MRKLLITALLSAVSIGLLYAGAGEKGHGHGGLAELAFGKAGDPKKSSREIAITMEEKDGKMIFTPKAIYVSRGEQIKFKITNAGELDHEIVFDTIEGNNKHAIEMQKNPDMEHDDPNAIRLKPLKKGEIIWQFTKAGTFDFSCLIPGHRESGMTGTITVK
jgi:uncharacterized cupredoxin-like copper-binding protein